MAIHDIRTNKREAGGGGASPTILKAVLAEDFSLLNSTTATDTGLEKELESGKAYFLDLRLILDATVNCYATPSLVFTGTSSVKYASEIKEVNSLLAPLGTKDLFSSYITYAGPEREQRYSGYIRTTSSGTLKVQIRQAIIHATDTANLLAGSKIECEKVI